MAGSTLGLPMPAMPAVAMPSETRRSGSQVSPPRLAANGGLRFKSQGGGTPAGDAAIGFSLQNSTLLLGQPGSTRIAISGNRFGESIETTVEADLVSN
ncbi:MAG: hypothetical protein ACKO3F_15290, partial [Cyanobium sp.]